MSAFSDETANPQDAYKGLPVGQVVTAERTFSDFLQEINWELRG